MCICVHYYVFKKRCPPVKRVSVCVVAMCVTYVLCFGYVTYTYNYDNHQFNQPIRRRLPRSL